MFKFLFLFLLSCFSMLSQIRKETSYSYGHNGMELMVTKNNETILINLYNAKVAIKEDIADKLFTLYSENALTTGKNITVTGNEAKVFGKVIIEKKDKLTSINFYYEKVEWNSGLTEIYKKPK